MIISRRLSGLVVYFYVVYIRMLDSVLKERSDNTIQLNVYNSRMF